MDMKKLEVLSRVFGYGEFRPGQESLIDCLVNGRDVLGIMPTGAGKSLCYQIPALLADGVTLVVSPLISLMKDQVSALTEAGVAAAFLNSALSPAQYEAALANAEQGRYKIIYVAPERLLTARFEQFLRGANIAYIIIDEAHCVSQWGHNFRPSYLSVGAFTASLEKRPVLGAFTATATEKVREDIVSLLGLRQPHVLVTGFDRANLAFETRAPKNKDKELLGILEARAGKSGIVYCATRAAVEEVCALLCRNGVSATRYHAGLPLAERQQNQSDFVYDDKRVMVATNAFGMGIDKSNVSFVVHYNMPKNIESYYQEAGRAGRDGEAADCILLYSPKDVQMNRFLISRSGGRDAGENLSAEAQEEIRKNELELLKHMTWYSTGTECLRRTMLRYFGEAAPIYCGNCSNCNRNYDEVDITEAAQKILSCVARIERMGRSAGKTMVANVLHGTDTIKISRNGFEALSTFGIMADVPVRRIVYTIEYLASQGYLTVTNGEYPVLKTNIKSLAALRGDAPISMKLPREKKPAAARAKNTAPPEGSEQLFEALAALRRQLSAKHKVPAYVIFSDAALRDMCQKQPCTEDEFLEVSGVGAAKLKRYGSAFLRVLREHNN